MGCGVKIVTKQIPPGCKLWDCGYLAWVEPEAPGQPGVPLSAATPRVKDCSHGN